MSSLRTFRGVRGVRATRAVVLTAVALSLSACVSLGPPYQRPELPVPEGYSQPTQPGAVADTWWTLFGDPDLDRLVEEALAANQDLAAAAARVAEARALLGLADAQRFPIINGEAGAGRTRFSASSAQIPPGVSPEFDNYRIAAGISYDFDFWGRYARASEAARAELLATEAGRQNVRLSLIAEVINAWFDLAAIGVQLDYTRETVGSRRESADLQQTRFDGGTISGLDLAQAQAELATAEAAVPALERQLRLTENRLGVLLGRMGGPIPRPDAARLAAFRLPEVPVGLPSELLARRPDVVAAEQQLIAAHARIAVARAAYFPSITLTGYAGTESDDLSNLLGSGTGIWQAALGLLQPIFNAGRTRRQVEAARAREQGALAAYTSSLQNAFADVEDALVIRRTSTVEREALERQVRALSESRNLAGLRYDAGESSYLEVLDAQRNLFRAQLDLTRARRDELVSGVTLFRALGGGWAGSGEPAAAEPQ